MIETEDILIVDDQPENLLILEDLLSEDYAVHPFDTPKAALAYLADGHPAGIILMDIMMPEMDGFDVCRTILALPERADTPIIFLTALDSPADEQHGLSLGAVDFVRKPFSPAVVLARIQTHLELSKARRLLAERNLSLEALVAERTREIEFQAHELLQRKRDLIAAQESTITAFCSLVEARDNETGNHILRTQRYVKAVALRLRDDSKYRDQLDDETIEMLYKSAPLHDIGKVAIPDHILLKPGKLDPEEWAIMQRHCEYGRKAIDAAKQGLSKTAVGYLHAARDIAYSHHERWDGTGYPQGLAGTAIPLSARLMALADVYDALISARPYKSPFSHTRAVAMIMEGRGTHFDPDVVDAFAQITLEFQRIADRLRDEDA